MAVSGDTDKIVNALDQWAQATQHGDAAELERIVDELLQQETSFAEKNAKRFKAVNDAFGKQDFEVTVNVVDALVQPLDHAVNALLKRTSLLKAIRFHIPSQSVPLQELKASSKDFFLKWSSGEFGKGIISDFLGQLQSEDLARHAASCSDQSIMDTCFKLIVFGMSDAWWRCCFVADTFPNKMFSLLSCDQQTFEQRWAEYRNTCLCCPECVDCGFSGPLLRSADLTAMSAGEVQSFFQECLGGKASTKDFPG